MATSHQTIVVELGSSRIKIGYAGESRPRRVLDDRYDDGGGGGTGGGGGWTVNIDDGMPSRACRWRSVFRHIPPSSYRSNDDDGDDGDEFLESPSSKSKCSSSCATSYEWERTLYPLFSHVLTSILFVQRPSRHRMLVLTSDAHLPHAFEGALHRVLLDYLGLGSVWLLNGGTFEGMHHVLEGLPPPLPQLGPPRAHMVVDIGTHEARVIVIVSGHSTLEDTRVSTSTAGYASFLDRVVQHYRDDGVEDDDESNADSGATVASLEDADAVVRAWISLASSSSSSSSSSASGTADEDAIVRVRLPSLERARGEGKASYHAADDATTVRSLSVGPLLRAYREAYLDYTDPSSLIYAILACAMACPMDYRRSATENVVLMGGGSVALRHFRSTSRGGNDASREGGGNSTHGLGNELEKAARNACGVAADGGDVGKSKGGKEEEEEEEEKKDDAALSCTSSVAKRRFRSLRGVIYGRVHGDDGDGRGPGGMHVRYPDPFAADGVAWLGGSIIGTLGYSSQYRSKPPRGRT
jgi:hypothetical protein